MVATALLCLAGCGDSGDGIHVYTVEKGSPHFGSLQQDADAAGADAQATGGDAAERAFLRSLVEWTMPAAWHEEPSNRPMVIAIFHTDHSHALEVQVSAFTGDVGGLLLNVNRWRNQLGLPPVTEAQAESDLQEIPTQGTPGKLFDATNPDTGKRTIAAILPSSAGLSWFVRATGDDRTVGAEKENIKTFAGSFRFKPLPAAHDEGASSGVLPSSQGVSGATSGTTPATPSPQAGGGGGSQMGQLPASMLPSASDEKLSLGTPENWEPVQPSSPVILQAFEVATAQGKVLMTITQLNGDGGGLLPNVNRWRGQMGLGPVASLSAQEQETLQLREAQALLFDLIAPQGTPQHGQRTLMAVVERPGRTWYFKAVGTVDQVQAMRAQFAAVVQSVTFTKVSP